MSTANPTQLHVGARGILNGREYRVAGRVVMSVFDNGLDYYWNEFQLENDQCGNAILVYEETKRSGEWRFFTRFDPPSPMSIADAEDKGVGDKVQFEGIDLYVTFVGTSSVSRIEGWAPKTEFLGKKEKYFNAESGLKMVVVSYTANEIEFYSGETLLGGVVEKAFHIPKPPRSAYAISRYDSKSDQQWVPFVAVIGVGLFFLLFIAGTTCDVHRAPALRVYSAQDLPHAEGESILFNSARCTILAHNLVEVSKQGARFDRHEFTLIDPTGINRLLIDGLSPNGKDCCLLTNAIPEIPLQPFQAGDLKAGQIIRAGGASYTVSDLFLCKSAPLGQPLTSFTDRSEVHYGLVARSGTTVLLVRWNETSITWQSGAKISADAMREFVRQLK